MHRAHYLLTFGCLIGTPWVVAEPLVIEITEGQIQLEESLQADPALISAAPVADSGEMLREINGVSGSRMGGRAIDPIIRGQQQTQINVLLDGAYLHGGCPNRMDPPTSYTSVDGYDQFTLIKGSRTVVYGSGGSGATLLFERDWPLFTEDNHTLGSLSSSYRDNGAAKELAVDLAIGSKQGFLRLLGHTGNSGNYQDGDGNRVNSSYQSEGGTLAAGIQLTEQTRLQGSYESMDEEDILFPGAGMDSPYANSDSVRLKLNHQFSNSPLDKLLVELYRTEVEHSMDNFSLRTLSLGGMPMIAPSSSDTLGGRVVFDAQLSTINWRFGADFQENQRNATLLNGMNGTKIGIQWPDVLLEQQGLFAEGEKGLDLNNSLKLGLRLDHFRAKAERTTEPFMMAGNSSSAAQLYKMSYGMESLHGQTQTDTQLSGFINWTHRLNTAYRVESSISRSIRVPDATERYMATGKWVGNPNLEAEKHHQLEIILAHQSQQMSWSLSGWYNRVDDFILREYTSNRLNYHNISAELYGAELEANYPLSAAWSIIPALAWTVGNNLETGRSLSQISPLQASLALSYQKQAWTADIQLQAASKQSDVCLKSSACNGLDLQETAGWGIINMNIGYQLDDHWNLSGGVKNLFDKAYSLHENREDILGNQTQVAEPGRALWLKLDAHF